MRPGVLTIGVDARELLGETTGTGRYLGELARRWAVNADGTRQFLLYSPRTLPFVEALGRDAPIRQVIVGSGTGTWWEQTHLRRAVRANPPDVFFAPAYTAPLALRVPLVVTIHDVSFAAHPEWFTPREGARRRLLTRQAARAADLDPDRLGVLAPGDPGTALRAGRPDRRGPAGRDATIRRPVQPLVPRAASCCSSDRSSIAAGCQRPSRRSPRQPPGVPTRAS